MKVDRAFLEMLRPAAERLAGREPERLACLCGCGYDGEKGKILVPSLGKELHLSWPELCLSPGEENWFLLVLLHYLDLGDGTPLTGRLLSFGEMKDGAVRGGNFDRTIEARARDLLSMAGEEDFRLALASLGARFMESNADLCAEIPFLPRWPLTVKIWFPDEELPGSGRLFADASADHYLTVEDAVTAGELVWTAIERKIEEKRKRKLCDRKA